MFSKKKNVSDERLDRAGQILIRSAGASEEEIEMAAADSILFARIRGQIASEQRLREEVADRYCADDGRPGIDPEVAVRLMLAGLLTGIVHDRRLMRDAQVNIAIRWFIGYSLHERLRTLRA